MSDIKRQIAAGTALPRPERNETTWRERIEALSPRAGGHPRVGLAWDACPEDGAASTGQISDWAPLADVRGVIFFRLSQDPADAASVTTAPSPFRDAPEIPGAAAVIENLDLVISICPAVTNLAEALGIPVWAVNPNAENPSLVFQRVADELRRWARLGDVDICIAQADEQILQGNLQAAEQRLWQLLEEAPDNAAVLNSLGVLLWRDGRAQESLTLLLTALEQDPLHRDTVLNCGDVFQNLGRDDDALALYANYLLAVPEDQEVRQIHDCVAATRIAVTA